MLCNYHETSQFLYKEKREKKKRVLIFSHACLYWNPKVLRGIVFIANAGLFSALDPTN